jgi:hypothetical protein
MPSKFDTIIAEETAKDGERGVQATSVLTLMIFAPVAFFVAGLPGYLFTTPMFKLGLEENTVVYGAVTAVTGCLLLKAYVSVTEGRYWKIWTGENGREERMKAAGLTISKKKNAKNNNNSNMVDKIREQTFLEAKAFALVKNNVLFLFLALLLNFVVCKPSMEGYPQVNYVISTIAPAVLLAFLSTYEQ